MAAVTSYENALYVPGDIIKTQYNPGLAKRSEDCFEGSIARSKPLTQFYAF